jgi:membrane-associated phospholipid phosphatase
MRTKPRLVALVLFVFLVNLGQTWLETSSHTGSPISAADHKGAYAVQQFEPELINFEFHDKTARWAMYAYSFSYFVLFPVLGFSVMVALARREELGPFRVLCLAIAADYVMSLPFFLLFPVPERWAYPESHAILLSDQWSSALINSIRPMSALNNSFPSTHVSLTVIMMTACWLFGVRLRTTVTALGMTVILATFVLGIHWLADIIAGATVGLLSVAIAWRWTDLSERPLLGLAPALAARRRPRPLNQLAKA